MTRFEKEYYADINSIAKTLDRIANALESNNKIKSNKKYTIKNMSKLESKVINNIFSTNKIESICGNDLEVHLYSNIKLNIKKLINRFACLDKSKGYLDGIEVVKNDIYDFVTGKGLDISFFTTSIPSKYPFDLSKHANLFINFFIFNLILLYKCTSKSLPQIDSILFVLKILFITFDSNLDIFLIVYFLLGFILLLLSNTSIISSTI
jgi:hypothetical protein